jgi:hypothetical protein
MFLWSLVFAYTWLTYTEAATKWRMIPVIINIMSNLILLPLLSQKAANTKTFLLALSWSIVISIGIILHSLNIYDNLALNVHITIMSAISAIVWCIMSHAEHVTEGGFHWYIWTMLVILSFCSAFNTENDNAQLIFMVSIVVTLIVHSIYIIHTIKIQPRGIMRCQHIFRIICALIINSGILIVTLLLHSETLTNTQWLQSIIAIEIIGVIVILVDSVIGFSQKPIKQGYMRVNNNDVV